jgi:formate dehydrogenase iron-sulfur subunit
MEQMKFLCDVNRCIDCNGCVVACKEGHQLPVNINRRRVITLNQGKPGEKSISVSCMHCTDAPCIKVCPVTAIYQRDDGIVLVNKETCIGCGYCFMACPYGAPQFPGNKDFGARGTMDKCTFCAGGPAETFSQKEKKLYGQNRIAEGKIPLCAGMCSTRALMAGDAEEILDIFNKRSFSRS